MILAGITIFNPDIEMLKKNIAAITEQVDGLICVDNGSTEIEVIEKEIQNEFPMVEIIKNHANLGIATALNQMFDYAKTHEFQWVLTLDQDSVCPDNLMTEYKRYMDIENLGSLCPVICNRNYENREVLDGEYTLMDKCITSASLTPVHVWEAVGGFLEELFIDFVDHDFSAKLIEQGYKIVRINSVLLEHEIGQGRDVCFFGKKITVLNHSPFRKYYMVRNAVYYMKQHKVVINVTTEKLKLMFLFIKTGLYENHRKEKLKEMFRGLKDAKTFCKEHVKQKG